MVVDFAGGELAWLEPEHPVTADVALTNAKVQRTYVEALPWKRGWRLFIDFEPDGKKLVDLRAVLQLRGQTLTETWTGVFRRDRKGCGSIPSQAARAGGGCSCWSLSSPHDGRRRWC